MTGDYPKVPADLPEMIAAVLQRCAEAYASVLPTQSPFRDHLAATDRGVQACFCPPMADSSDPEQHEVGCLGAEAIRVRRFWDGQFRGFECRPIASPRSRSWSPPVMPGACYEASFGWVHVRPGCHCPGR